MVAGSPSCDRSDPSCPRWLEGAAIRPPGLRRLHRELRFVTPKIVPIWSHTEADDQGARQRRSTLALMVRPEDEQLTEHIAARHNP